MAQRWSVRRAGGERDDSEPGGRGGVSEIRHEVAGRLQGGFNLAHLPEIAVVATRGLASGTCRSSARTTPPSTSGARTDWSKSRWCPT